MPVKTPIEQLNMSELKDLSAKLGIDMKNHLRNKERAISRLSELVEYQSTDEGPQFMLKPQFVPMTSIENKPKKTRTPKKQDLSFQVEQEDTQKKQMKQKNKKTKN
jgi:hypothetical protein